MYSRVDLASQDLLEEWAYLFLLYFPPFRFRDPMLLLGLLCWNAGEITSGYTIEENVIGLCLCVFFCHVFSFYFLNQDFFPSPRS